MSHRERQNRNRKQYLQELCVYGFIRTYFNHDIPDELKRLCLSMYLIVFDSWDVDLSHESFEVVNESGDLIANGNETSNEPNLGERWRNAFGTLVIKKGDIKTWKIQITNKNPRAKNEKRAVFYMGYVKLIHSMRMSKDYIHISVMLF